MFRKFIKYITFAVISVISLQVYALDLPTKEINGKSYFYYEVQPKETIYSLCKQLGITKDEIIKYNPSVADGLRANQMLYFPVSAYNDTTSSAPTDTIPDSVGKNGIIYHSIQKKESLYSIAKSYNTTVENLLELNPGLSPNDYKAGTTIRIRPNEAKEAESQAEIQPEATDTNTPILYKQYTVKKKETIYSIAKQHNVTIDDIKKANPGLEQLKKGQIINIPDTEDFDATKQQQQQNPSIEEIYEDVHDKTESKDIRIAIMLPFMLSQKTPSKQAQLYTDFYKGFLLAVDSLRNIGTPIHINVYDTKDNLATVKSILAKPELKTMNVIISPDDEVQFAAIASFGKKNNCNIFNLFAVKDTLYRENDHILQVNIPHSMMYTKVIDAIVSDLSDVTPVFVSKQKDKQDKAEFINTFKQLLDIKGIEYKNITYSKYLLEDDLASLPKNGKYIFIPTSGSQNAFLNIANTLRQFKESMDAPNNLKVFGYPEWTTFKGEIQERLHSLDVTIYSRFYNDAENYRSKEIEEKFQLWYGAPMMNAIPKQGILGFDAGMYIIKALKKNHGDFNHNNYTYNGIQSGYKFKRTTAWSGLVNNSLYLINFRPSGIIEKTEIK